MPFALLKKDLLLCKFVLIFFEFCFDLIDVEISLKDGFVSLLNTLVSQLNSLLQRFVFLEETMSLVNLLIKLNCFLIEEIRQLLVFLLMSEHLLLSFLEFRSQICNICGLLGKLLGLTPAKRVQPFDSICRNMSDCRFYIPSIQILLELFNFLLLHSKFLSQTIYGHFKFSTILLFYLESFLQSRILLV